MQLLTEEPLCNFKINNWPPADFVFSTCILCHLYLFSQYPPPVCKQPSSENSTVEYEDGTTRVQVAPKFNASNIWAYVNTKDGHLFRIDLDCSHLSKMDCLHWRHCCEAADSCCKYQLLLQQKNRQAAAASSRKVTASTQNAAVTSSPTGKSYCSATWDGFSCFEPAPPNSVVLVRCPRFYNAASRGSGYKRCEANGTWFGKNGQPWTDWTACVPPVLTEKFALGLALSCLSVVTLLWSIFTFLCYPQLWQQIRIRIHTSMFTAVLFYNLAAIPNDVVFVLYGGQETELVKISESYFWTACLAGMRFFKVANFSWMFCEGLFLLRLLKNGLRPPRRAATFYVVGWGFPVILVGTYYAVKYLVLGHISSSSTATATTERSSSQCDIKPQSSDDSYDPATLIEWIIHAPCLATLATNYAFLFAIIRIMTGVSESNKPEGREFLRRVSTASISLPSRAAEKRYMEREATKKATRAIFLLSPLLGTYVLFTLFKSPSMDDERWQEFRWFFMSYEMLQTIADRVQGFAVSVAFCLSTKEVRKLYGRSVDRRSTLLGRQGSLTYSVSARRRSSATPISSALALATSNAFVKNRLSTNDLGRSKFRRSLAVITENVGSDSGGMDEDDDDAIHLEAITIKPLPTNNKEVEQN